VECGREGLSATHPSGRSAPCPARRRSACPAMLCIRRGVMGSRAPAHSPTVLLEQTQHLSSSSQPSSHPAIQPFSSCSLPLSPAQAFGIHDRLQSTVNCHPSPRIICATLLAIRKGLQRQQSQHPSGSRALGRSVVVCNPGCFSHSTSHMAQDRKHSSSIKAENPAAAAAVRRAQAGCRYGSPANQKPSIQTSRDLIPSHLCHFAS